jgi:FkbM family methyltransferase
MKLSTYRGNPLLSAYSFVKRSGFLETSLGRRFFKSAYFIYKRYFEDDLEDLIRAFPSLVRGGSVIDVGANIGYTATVFARATTPGEKVFAFEPEPSNFRILEQTAHQREFISTIVPLQLAVGAENSSINLWINDHHHADHRVITEQFGSVHPDSKQVSVSLVSIDSFLADKPGNISLIKIDVQGYELAVCQGMQQTLRQNPDIAVILEFMPSAMRELGFHADDLIEFMLAREFRIYCVHPKGKLSPGLPEFKDDLTYFDLLFTRKSIPVDRTT